MNLLRALVSTSGFTLLSRVTGLVRDIVIAKTMGASSMRDAFEIAFQLSNFLRRLFAEGAFSQAFVPALGRVRANEGDEEARRLIDRIATIQAIALIVFTALGVLIAPWLVLLFASGFKSTAGQFELTTDLLRLMMPYSIFISMVALAGGVLNTWKHFSIPAFTPVLLNLSMIAGAVWLSPLLKQPIFGLAWGVLLGGIAQLAMQVRPLMKRDLMPWPDFHYRDPRVSSVFRAMGPALLGVGVAQISMLINTNYASYFGEGSVSWLKTADRLMEFPTALLGVALGTILLPSLAQAAAKKEIGFYNDLLDWGLRLTVMLALPAAVVMATLGEPITAMLLERGRFSASDVAQTNWAVMAYAVGVWGLVSIKILAPGFYVHADVRTPVRYAIVALIVAQILNVVLVFFVVPQAQRHAALALGTSISALINATLLLTALRKRGYYTPKAGWLGFICRVGIALLVLTALCVYGRDRLGPWFGISEWMRVGKLLSLLGVAGLVYCLSLALLGLRLRDFRR